MTHTHMKQFMNVEFTDRINKLLRFVWHILAQWSMKASKQTNLLFFPKQLESRRKLREGLCETQREREYGKIRHKFLWSKLYFESSLVLSQFKFVSLHIHNELAHYLMANEWVSIDAEILFLWNKIFQMLPCVR